MAAARGSGATESTQACPGMAGIETFSAAR